MKLQKVGLTILLTVLTTVGAVPLMVPPARGVKSTVAQSQDERGAEADRLLRQGNRQYDVSKTQAALESWEAALKIYREIGDRKSEAYSLNNLGIVYFSLGQYEGAKEYYQQSLEISKEIGDRSTEGKSLNNLGNVYGALGQYEGAREYFQQSLEISKETGDRSAENTSLNNLGNICSSLGEYRQAIEYYGQSLEISKEIGDRQNQSLSLNGLGIIYRNLGQYRQAIEYYRQSVEISKKIGDRLNEGLSLNNLGFALFKTGNLPAAEKNLLSAIEVYESIRADSGGDANKISIFETQPYVYRNLQKVLIAQNKTDTALEISERGRARAFVELLAARFAPSDKTASAPPTIAEIKRIAKEQNATIVEYSWVGDRFEIEGKQEVKESSLYIWVVKPTGEVTFRQTDLTPLWQQQDTSLGKIVAEARRCFDSNTCRQSILSTNRELKELHQLLIQPVADLLPTDPNARIIFIPQDALFLVPFPALQDKRGKYLIEKHTIMTAPAIQVLDLAQKRDGRQKAGEVLIVGNPTMPKVSPGPDSLPRRLSPLPGAEREAREIGKFLNSKPLIGNLATEPAVVQKMPTARIIHLATHGSLDSFQGINSWVALTPEGNDDGLLAAAEIFDLDLQAELVVLSACSTGQGKLSGDGVIGLSRSFLSAGAKTIVVSLWPVPDKATRDLMTEFYRQWEENPDKARALRQAMLATMKKYPDPKNWAAFTIVGEAESALNKETIQSKNYRQENNTSRGFLLIIILAAIGASIYFLFFSTKQPKCSALRKQLLVLVNNREDVADRLIKHAKLRYPGHPENWYYEKVIYDLKRGR